MVMVLRGDCSQSGLKPEPMSGVVRLSRRRKQATERPPFRFLDGSQKAANFIGQLIVLRGTEEPTVGMASNTCNCASTPPARNFRCIRTVLDRNRSRVQLEGASAGTGGEIAEQWRKIRVSEIVFARVQSDGSARLSVSTQSRPRFVWKESPDSSGRLPGQQTSAAGRVVPHLAPAALERRPGSPQPSLLPPLCARVPELRADRGRRRGHRPTLQVGWSGGIR